MNSQPSFGNIFGITLKVIGALLLLGLAIGFVYFALQGGSTGLLLLVVVVVIVVALGFAHRQATQAK